MVRADSPSRHAPSPNSAAVNPNIRSGERANNRSPARFTSRNFASLSKVKIATSISSITVRNSAVASNAPSRCSRKVSLSALTSIITSPMASSLRASRPRTEKSSSRKAASKFESVCKENATRCRSENANPSQNVMIRNPSVQTVREE